MSNLQKRIERARRLVNRLETKDEDLTEKENADYNKAMDTLIESGLFHF